MRAYAFNDRNYYQYLNIDKNAIPEVVSAAYRGLMKKYHPDLNLGNREAEEKAKKINEAYEVLSDPAKRKAYDDWLNANDFGTDFKRNKTDGTGAGRNTHQTTQNTQSYKIDFDYIRKQAFKSYDAWYRGKCDTYERRAARKKKARHTFAAVFVLLILIGIGGTGYIYRKQLSDWIKEKKPGFPFNVQAASHREYIKLPSVEGQTDVENGEGGNAGIENENDTISLNAYRVTADAVNVRPNPSAEQERIGKLSKGDICSGTGCISDDGKWVQIYLYGNEGDTGWVFAQYLTSQEEIKMKADLTADTYLSEEPASQTGSKASAEYMDMTVTAVLLDNSTVQLVFDNNTSTEFSIGGWSLPQEACLTTTKGEYWTKFNTWMGFKIETHTISEFTLSFENVEGEVSNT